VIKACVAAFLRLRSRDDLVVEKNSVAAKTVCIGGGPRNWLRVYNFKQSELAASFRKA
jgi:hypothetical protein